MKEKIMQHYFIDLAKCISDQIDASLRVDFSQNIPNKEKMLAQNVDITLKLTDLDLRTTIIKIIANNFIDEYLYNNHVIHLPSQEDLLTYFKATNPFPKLLKKVSIAIEAYEDVLEAKTRCQVKPSSR